MYQNFNCCSSDWMERTKYIQGRSGTKSKDCLPFVQYYKCLENKIENENIQYLHLCSAFPAHIPLGNSCQHPILFPPSQDPQNPSHFCEKFCPRPSLQSCWLSCCNIQSIFSFFLQPLMGPVPSPLPWGWKDSKITFKNENYLETEMSWKDLCDALLPSCWGSHYVVDPPSLLWTLYCSQFCLTK